LSIRGSKGKVTNNPKAFAIAREDDSLQKGYRKIQGGGWPVPEHDQAKGVNVTEKVNLSGKAVGPSTKEGR